MDNANSPEYLAKIKQQVYENLRRTQAVPSVQMQDVPREPLGMTDETVDEQDDRLDDEEADQEENKDKRYTQRDWDKKIQRDDEFEESDDEEMADANGIKKQPGRPRRRGIMDYQNPHAPADESGANTPAQDDARSINGDVVDEPDTNNVEADEMQVDSEAVAAANGATDVAEDKATVASDPAPTANGAPTVEATDEAVPKTEDTSTGESNSNEMQVDAAKEEPAESTVTKVEPTEPNEPAQKEEEAAAAPASEQAQSEVEAPPATEAPGVTGTAPSQSTAGTDVEMSEDVAKEREEGMMERTLEDTAAEAATEAASGGPSAQSEPAA